MDFYDINNGPTMITHIVQRLPSNQDLCQKVLEERESQYGDFRQNLKLIALFKNNLKITITSSKDIQLDDNLKKHTQDFINSILALKLARIVLTNYDFNNESKDSYIDFINYIDLFKSLGCSFNVRIISLFLQSKIKTYELKTLESMIKGLMTKDTQEILTPLVIEHYCKIILQYKEQ